MDLGLSDSEPSLFSWFLSEQTELVFGMSVLMEISWFFYSKSAAPKRKRPRPVKYEDDNPSIFNAQNSPLSSSAKLLPDQPAEIETSSPILEKNSGSAAENGGVAYDLAQSHAVPASTTEAQPESIKAEGNNVVSDSKLVSEKSESQDLRMSKEESQSPKKDSPELRLDDNREDTTTNKA